MTISKRVGWALSGLLTVQTAYHHYRKSWCLKGQFSVKPTTWGAPGGRSNRSAPIYIPGKTFIFFLTGILGGVALANAQFVSFLSSMDEAPGLKIIRDIPLLSLTGDQPMHYYFNRNTNLSFTFVRSILNKYSKSRKQRQLHQT